MSGYTVLVLGAGASLAYGLPLGKGLIENICALLPGSDASYMGDKANSLFNQLSGYREAAKSWHAISGKELSYALIEFRQRLIESDPKSIDEFLARDFGDATAVFRQIGKLSIAHVIAASESAGAFDIDLTNPSKDRWYRYLWQDCLNAGSRSLDDLKAKKLRIVSFNYDRSLEYFLGKHIAATYLSNPGRLLDPAKVRTWALDGFKEVESNLQITHPYGTLGSLSAVPYGDTNNPQYHGVDMAQCIRVIGEERSDKGDSFAQARNWISEATRVVFLGFSYDSMNMERLGLDTGLTRQISTSESVISREVFPLTYGLERAERMKLYSQYFAGHFQSNPEWLYESANDRLPFSEMHHNISITDYLRRYGALTHL